MDERQIKKIKLSKDEPIEVFTKKELFKIEKDASEMDYIAEFSRCEKTMVFYRQKTGFFTFYSFCDERKEFVLTKSHSYNQIYNVRSIAFGENEQTLYVINNSNLVKINTESLEVIKLANVSHSPLGVELYSCKENPSITFLLVKSMRFMSFFNTEGSLILKEKRYNFTRDSALRKDGRFVFIEPKSSTSYSIDWHDLLYLKDEKCEQSLTDKDHMIMGMSRHADYIAIYDNAKKEMQIKKYYCPRNQYEWISSVKFQIETTFLYGDVYFVENNHVFIVNGDKGIFIFDFKTCKLAQEIKTAKHSYATFSLSGKKFFTLENGEANIWTMNETPGFSDQTNTNNNNNNNIRKQMR